jgi:hypothetical protein
MFDELRMPLGFSPDDLAYATPKPEEMSFLQLNRFIRKVESEGYDATRYRVDLQAKASFPFHFPDHDHDRRGIGGARQDHGRLAQQCGLRFGNRFPLLDRIQFLPLLGLCRHPAAGGRGLGRQSHLPVPGRLPYAALMPTERMKISGLNKWIF